MLIIGGQFGDCRPIKLGKYILIAQSNKIIVLDYETLKTIKVIDTITNHTIQLLQQRENSDNQFFVMVYKRIYLCYFEQEQYKILASYDIENKEKILNTKIIQNNDNLYILTQINNQSFIYCCDISRKDQKLEVIYQTDQQLSNIIKLQNNIFALVCGSKLILMDSSSYQKMREIDYPQIITEIHYDTQSQTLYIGQMDGKIYIQQRDQNRMIHKHYSKILSLTTFKQQLLSLQCNKNQFIYWYMMNKQQQYKNIQVTNETLKRIDSVEINSYIILNEQLQVIKQINSFSGFNNHQFVKYDDNKLYINQINGFVSILDTDTMQIEKFTPCDRENIQAYDIQYEYEQVIDLCLSDQFIFSLVSFNEKMVSLNILDKETKQTLYSIYNVLLDAFQIQAYHFGQQYLIAVLSYFGLKLYVLNKDYQLQLKYLGFIKIDNCVSCSWLQNQQKQIVVLTQNALQLIQINTQQNLVFQTLKQVQIFGGNQNLIVTKDNILIYNNQNKSLYQFNYELEQEEEQKIDNCNNIIYNGEEVYIYNDQKISQLNKGQIKQIKSAQELFGEKNQIRQIQYLKQIGNNYIALYFTNKLLAINTGMELQEDAQFIHQQILQSLTVETTQNISDKQQRHKILLQNKNNIDSLTGSELLQRIYQIICE